MTEKKNHLHAATIHRQSRTTRKKKAPPPPDAPEVVVAFDLNNLEVRQAIENAVVAARSEKELEYKQIRLPGQDHLPYPPGHAVSKPTSETAVVGEKRRTPSPVKQTRATPLRWDEDATMDDFTLDDIDA